MRTRLISLGLAGAWIVASGLLMGSPPAGATGPSFTGQAVVHYPGAVAATDASGQPLAGPPVQLFETKFFSAGEPTIGVTKNGTVYSDDFTQAVASSDEGFTWRNLAAPGVTSLDPYLYVDPATGRVFKSDLLGTCQDFRSSDDAGVTWSRVPAACNLSDHQTIAAGPPTVSPTQGYPNVVYDCSQSLGYNGYSTGSICDKSLDGGTTWIPTGSPAFNDPSPYGLGPGSGDSGVPGHCNGDIGHVFVGPDGTVYVPRGWCGQPWVAMSRDEGLTWTRVQVASNGMNTTVTGGFGLVAPGSGQSDHEASVVADAHGNVYYMWIALDRLPYLAVSRDHGATWSAPMMVGPPGLTEAWGPANAIDAAGHVALAYMGSTNSPGAPWTGDYAATTWTGYVAIIQDPLAARPLIDSAPVTPPSHPLVKGACGPDRCGPELDFVDVQMGPDGSAWSAYVDGTKRNELVVARLFPVA